MGRRIVGWFVAVRWLHGGLYRWVSEWVGGWIDGKVDGHVNE